jgi:hypothetical protein
VLTLPKGQDGRSCREYGSVLGVICSVAAFQSREVHATLVLKHEHAIFYTIGSLEMPHSKTLLTHLISV